MTSASRVVFFCEHFIDLGGWSGTYCKRPAGHEGDHSALYTDEMPREFPEPSDPLLAPEYWPEDV